MNARPEPGIRSSSKRPRLRYALAAALLLASFRADLGPPLLAGPMTQCFPTCDVTDARFLIVPGGGGADTFTRNEIVIGLKIPNSEPSFTLGVFDAETGGTWDQGAVPLNYDIYNDPNGDGVPNGGPVFSETGVGKPNNAWYDFPPIPTTPAAQPSPGADFRYVLVVSNPDTNPFTWSSFKIRTDQDLRISPQAFSFLAPLGNQADANIVYPSFPALTPTTYDGTWEFFMELPFPVSNMAIWDGDHDYGSSDCAVRDTDDFNTPNSVPSFAVGSSARPEGEATAEENIPDCTPGVKPSGNPPDDDFGPQGNLYRRSPHVQYEIIDPSGVNIYRNFNPSGNREWERFVISVNAGDLPDYLAQSLPAGIYKLRMTGMDMGNVNAWRFPFDLVSPQRRIRIGKVTGTAIHPQQDFFGTITPGGPASAFTLGLPQNQAVSPIQSYDVTTASHIVTEAPVPADWTLMGYTIKPDPFGQASCSIGENYTGSTISIPADSFNYLICIRNDFDPTDRVMRVRKITGTAQHPAATFNGTVSPGPATSFSLTLAQDQALSPAQTLAIDTNSQVVTESAPPAGWTLIGYTVKPDPNLTATCTLNENYVGGNAIVPSGFDRFLVCIRNDFEQTQERIVRFQKVTKAPDHPGGTFTGPISPGGPDTSYSLTLGINQHLSPVQSRVLNTSAHAVTETVPADWELKGFIVKPDPNGTATCALDDPYSGTTAQIPTGTGRYLVCIRNEPTCPPDPYKAQIETTVNQQAGTVTIRGYLTKTYADNTYGANAIGWPSGHKFNDLVGSDQMTFELYDVNGTKKMVFDLDYVSQSNTVPSGYKTLGVDGGEGGIAQGIRSDVVGYRTSISENLNTVGCVLLVDSPPTDASYTPHASCPNWEFTIWYEATVKLSAFGAAGFGRASVPAVHASPNKKPLAGGCTTVGQDYCDSHGKPTHITVEYVGGTCASSNTSQPQPKKFKCTDSNGAPQQTSPVWVVAGYNNAINQSVVLGQSITMPTGGQSNTFVKIYTANPAQGGQLLESLQIHTSCSAPLIIGDQFGAVVLTALSPP